MAADMVVDMKVKKVDGMVVDMEVDMVADLLMDMKVDKVAEDMADMVANMEAQITTTNHAICIDAIVLGRLAPFLKSESLSFYFWCK